MTIFCGIAIIKPKVLKYRKVYNRNIDSANIPVYIGDND